MKDVFTNFDHPREKAIEAMQTSIPTVMWESNSRFVGSIRDLIRQHPVARHPAIDILNKGALSHERASGTPSWTGMMCMKSSTSTFFTGVSWNGCVCDQEMPFLELPL